MFHPVIEAAIATVVGMGLGIVVMLAAGAVFSWAYMGDRQAEIDDTRGFDPLCDETWGENQHDDVSEGGLPWTI